MYPILLLHGALGSKQQLEPLGKLFEATGRTVYYLNFSGHGGEPFSKTGFGIEVFSDNVIHFLDKQQLTTIDIFGYSMGGYVALWCAYQNPDRIGRIITLGTKFDWSRASALHETSKLHIEKIIEKIPAFARLLEHRHAPNDWKELITKTKNMMLQLGDQPLLTLPILESISHKCLILLGDQDDMADRDYSITVAEVLPNGKFYLLNNTSHPIEKLSHEALNNIIGQS